LPQLRLSCLSRLCAMHAVLLNGWRL
jgi:hypothetical protein